MCTINESIAERGVLINMKDTSYTDNYYCSPGSSDVDATESGTTAVAAAVVPFTCMSLAAAGAAAVGGWLMLTLMPAPVEREGCLCTKFLGMKKV